MAVRTREVLVGLAVATSPFVPNSTAGAVPIEQGYKLSPIEITGLGGDLSVGAVDSSSVSVPGNHTEHIKRDRRSYSFCAPLGNVVLRLQGGEFVPVKNKKGDETKIRQKKFSQVKGLYAAPGTNDGTFVVKVTTGPYAGRYLAETDTNSANPTAKGPVYRGLCLGADKYVAPGSGGAPSPDGESFPGDTVEVRTGTIDVEGDGNLDGAVSYKNKAVLIPNCDDDTGANPATFDGSLLLAKGLSVLGYKANIIGKGYTQSLLSTDTIPVDPFAWQVADTTNQVRVDFPSRSLSKPKGAEFRVTARLATKSGGAVNIILRQDVEECIDRDSSGAAPATDGGDPDIGGEVIE